MTHDLITRLRNSEHLGELADRLEARGHTTWDAVFSALRDPNADPETLRDASDAVFFFAQEVDRRRAAPALLVALKSENADVRLDVTRALAQIGSKAAVPALMQRLADKSEAVMVRIQAAIGLGYRYDERPAALIREIAFDETDDVRVRAEVIEWAYDFLYRGDVADFVTLLGNPSPDIRFWTAFALASLSGTGNDISDARNALDHIAAFDDTLPEHFHWQVGREALRPLEHIHFQPYQQFYTDEDGDERVHFWTTYVVSPAVEYFSRYLQDITPDPALRINPAWLRSQVERDWPDATFDAHPPGTQTYTLSWLATADGYHLLCGLHRDGYALVLTGTRAAVQHVALWYRDILPDETLYLYEWAEKGISLGPNLTLADLRKAR